MPTEDMSAPPAAAPTGGAGPEASTAPRPSSLLASGWACWEGLGCDRGDDADLLALLRARCAPGTTTGWRAAPLPGWHEGCRAYGTLDGRRVYVEVRVPGQYAEPHPGDPRPLDTTPSRGVR